MANQLTKDYHVSCRVRSLMHGIDAGTTDHADLVIKADTSLKALLKWLENPDSYLHCPADNQHPIVSQWMDGSWSKGLGEFEAKGIPNDWETSDLNIIIDVLHMGGTACCGELEFEVTIKAAVAAVVGGDSGGLPVGGDYTVVFTFINVPRSAVEHMIEDVCQNGDYPADSSDLTVDEETADEKWHY